MHRQTGDLKIDENGLARSGLLVRHLVMPNGEAGTKEIARFLAEEISADTYVNVMGQYRPCGRAYEFEELTAPLKPDELLQAKREAMEAGLTRLDERKRFPFGHI